MVISPLINVSWILNELSRCLGVRVANSSISRLYNNSHVTQAVTVTAAEKEGYLIMEMGGRVAKTHCCTEKVALILFL